MSNTDTTSSFTAATVLDTVLATRKQFLTAFLLVLSATYGFLLVIDFVPEPPEDGQVAGVHTEVEAVDDVTESADIDQLAILSDVDSGDGGVGVDTTATQDDVSALPLRMTIDALDRTIPILNPHSRVVEDLDAALLRGAVRHPDAADFKREGNMLILGHSSHLPNVMNRNYQIFNDIETLRWGDTIRVYSEDTEYIYRVDRVYEAKASALVIPIADTGPKLTLATCDSFGSIDDRFIVEATLHATNTL